MKNRRMKNDRFFLKNTVILIQKPAFLQLLAKYLPNLP